MAVCLSDSPPSQGPSCPVCFRDYSDNETELIPRILQCGHTYCSECLDRLLNTIPDEDEYQQVILNIRYAGREWTTTRNYPRVSYSPSNDIKCPTCKTINHIQNRDVATLTKNFALLGCRPQTSGNSNKTTHFCKNHNHEKRIYCNDCKTLICAYCQLYGDHMNHKFVVATEASKPSIESLRLAEESLSKDLNNLENGENEVNQTISKLTKTKRKCERNVRRYFGGAIERLEEHRDVLLSQISSWMEEQSFILNAQLDMLVNATKDVKSAQSNCQALVEGDPLDALTEHQKVEEKVMQLRDRISGLSLQPLITPWMRAKEEGPCNVTLSMLVENFKLTYNTDSISGDKEGDDPDNQSDTDSESSADSLMGGTGGLPDVLGAYRLRSLEMRGSTDKMEGGGGGGWRGKKRKHVHSQETQSLVPIEGEPLDPVESSHSTGHWVSSVNPSSMSLFNQRNQRMMHGLNMSATHHLLDDASESNSDAENLLFRRDRFLERLSANGSNESEGDLENGNVQASSHHLELGSSGVGVGVGVESVLDSLEIRRHWNFLNGNSGDASGGENNSKEEEDDADLDLSDYHPLTLAYDTEGRSAHSSSSPSSSPSSPRMHHGSPSDFAFPHHLGLPVDSGRDPNDEVVFPSSPPYSWTNPRGNGRGRDYLLQASISPSNSDVVGVEYNTEELDMDNR